MRSGHDGKRYIIVGGTSGMGFAAAERLSRDGACVAVLGRDTVRAQEAAARLGTGSIGLGVAEEGVANVVARSAEALGGLDGLVVTAGPFASTGDITQLTDDQWSETFDIQLMTVVRSLRTAIPMLQANGGGSIVTTAAYSMHATKPYIVHYTAMKAAIASVTKNVAKQFGPDGIRANCIAPGAVASEALDSTKAKATALYGGDPMKALDRYVVEQLGMKVALGRIGQPAEIGNVIAFLLSGEAPYLTGSLINIDGGTDF